MSEFLFFGLILVAVVAVGAWWMLRSAAQPADVEGGDPDAAVVVGGPWTHMDVEIYRSKLGAAGIFAYTRNRTGPAMPGGVAPQLFGWEVLVRGADAEAELPSSERLV